MVRSTRRAGRSAAMANGRFSAGFQSRAFVTPLLAAFKLPSALLVFVVDLPQELLDALAAIDRLVVGEVEVGGEPQLQLDADLVAQVAARLLQGLAGVRALLVVAVHRPVDARLAQVGRHLDSGDGDQPDARVAHALGEELPEQLLDHLRHALGAVVGGHFSRSSSVSHPSSPSGCGSLPEPDDDSAPVRSCASKSGFCDQSEDISEYVSISISRLTISAMLPASRAHLSSTS